MQKTIGPRFVQNQLLIGQLIFALASTALSPLLQPLQLRFGLSVFEMSILPTTYTVFVAITNIAAGVIMSRFGARVLHQVGGVVALLAAGLGLFAGGFVGLLFAWVAFGIGMALGFVTLTTIYSHQPERYRDFGRYHAFFGLAGILSPILVSLTLESQLSYGLFFIGIAALVLINIIVFAVSPHIQDVKGQPLKLAEIGKKLLDKVLLRSLFALAIYACAEIGVVTFAMSINTQIYGLAESEAALWFSSFWVCYTLSRFVTDGVIAKFGLQRVIGTAALLAMLCISLWIAELSPVFLTLTGFFVAPVFPALQKNMNNLVPASDRGLVNGATYAFTGTIASAMLPVMGALGDIRLTFAAIPPVFLLLGLLLLMRGQKVAGPQTEQVEQGQGLP